MAALAKGTQGSWFATVTKGPFKGQRLPCVRKDFITTWPDYHDPIAGQPLQTGYFPAVQAGRVILVDVAQGRHYISVLGVTNVRLLPSGLHFSFV